MILTLTPVSSGAYVGVLFYRSKPKQTTVKVCPIFFSRIRFLSMEACISSFLTNFLGRLRRELVTGCLSGATSFRLRQGSYSLQKAHFTNDVRVNVDEAFSELDVIEEKNGCTRVNGG